MFDPNEGLLEIVEVNGAVETSSSVVVSQRSVQPERRYGFIPREKFDNINTGKGLRIQRFFTQPGVDPFDTVEWERRTAVIAGERGEVVFEQKDVEVPAFWSQLATNVVASKYFRGQIGTPEREHSVRQVIGRVVETLTRWGREMGYFASEQDAEAFRDELKHLLLYQYAAFNSPVWFNVGIEPRPQCSACFIVSVEDTMESILDLAKTEGMIFKFGSGSGSNLSRIRGSKEYLSGGGRASGPVSFMRGFDAFAGVIKSGGKTRRAAKMVVLNIDHPDIVDFIECKAKEEKKAWALIEAGYDPGFDTPGGAYDSVFFQNANHSVRVTDEFMRAVEQDGEWCTYARTTGAVMGRYRARELFRKIAEAAWVCGDPGLQFHDTTNKWHTVKNSGSIEASNPCSEFVFLNDTSCNLASLNLMKFRLPDGRFDVEAFRAAVCILITAQEIIVDNSAYPTERICDNSHNFRPLGLGYANLGALLMSLGLPYDSDVGRAYAAIITAIMHGEAYRQSAMIARDCGAPFPGFALNREPMLEVMRMHADALNQIPSEYVPDYLLQTAREIYQEMLQLGEQYGYRNAQVTVLAPTGTISFMMDCDTTGIEPDIALVKYKTLVGGGMLKIVNTTVPLALQQLGYSPEQIEAITRYIDEHDTIEGAPYLKEEHLPVFDCAFRPAKGTRSLAPMAHVKMMAAVQSFLSGAISKTVNVPNDATPEDIEQIYMQAWKMGLKAIAIYRDGSKRTQPLSTKKPSEQESQLPVPTERPVRRHLPDERRSITHKFSIAGHEGYITVGMYEDGTPGEIFITMAKEGSVISGLMDAFATAISLALQYGVPLEKLVEKFSYTRFQPSGFTNNPQIPVATSIVDYIFRWLGMKFLNQQPPQRQPLETLEEPSAPPVASATAQPEAVGITGAKETPPSLTPTGQGETMDWSQLVKLQQDAPPCPVCGMIMVRAGACISVSTAALPTAVAKGSPPCTPPLHGHLDWVIAQQQANALLSRSHVVGMG
jgi:ribonucleoside-diphosphate reductase alpha chain